MYIIIRVQNSFDNSLCVILVSLNSFFGSDIKAFRHSTLTPYRSCRSFDSIRVRQYLFTSCLTRIICRQSDVSRRGEVAGRYYLICFCTIRYYLAVVGHGCNKEYTHTYTHHTEHSIVC